MKKIIFITFFLTFIFCQNDIVVTSKGDTVLLFSDYTYKFKKELSSPKSKLSLRITKIGKSLGASQSVIREAQALAKQGWRYTLPSPKSAQASWGNYDGRTTWWYGYWKNIKSNKYSSTKPVKKSNGYYKGDGQNQAGYYRRGGSPRYTPKLEAILSKL